MDGPGYATPSARPDDSGGPEAVHQEVLIGGAAGGVGVFAVQPARTAGVRPAAELQAGRRVHGKVVIDL